MQLLETGPISSAQPPAFPSLSLSLLPAAVPRLELELVPC